MRIAPIGAFFVSVLFVLFFLLTWSSYPGTSRVRNSVEVEVDAEELSVQRRLQDAEAIWERGVANRELAAKRPVPDSNPWTLVSFRVFWDFFYPDYNCPHNVERLGRVGDGGKWVCGIPQLVRKGDDCIVYSYGIAGEVSFEQAILDRTSCSVHGYDHTIDVKKIALPKKYPGRATISKLGIGVKDEGNLRTLKSEMDKRNHTFIDILKMDVESHEFAALDQIMGDFPNGLPFGQLIIELHIGGSYFPAKKIFSSFKVFWEKLEAAGLRAFHSEPNWYILAMKKEKRDPACFEYSFLNVKVDHAILHA